MQGSVAQIIHSSNYLAEAVARAVVDQADLYGFTRSLVALWCRQRGEWTTADLTDLHPQAGIIMSFLGKSNAYENWARLNPRLLTAFARLGAGINPWPAGETFAKWRTNKVDFYPILGPESISWPYTWLNLQAENGPFADPANVTEVDRFAASIDHLLTEAKVQLGVGGYGEERPFYISPAYRQVGNAGERWRSLHLGLDLWMPAGTPFYAPLAGQVLSVADNAGERDYGPTLILAHNLAPPEPTFYSLYGHLDGEILRRWAAGESVAAGQLLGYIGDRPENGNWPPHLHWQLMLDMLDRKGDFPGVAFPDERDIWLGLCPDPFPLSGLGGAVNWA